MYKKYFSSLLLLVLGLLSGCGSAVQNSDTMQPHMKNMRAQIKDWTWNVGATYTYDQQTKNAGLLFEFYSKRPKELVHYQVFLDFKPSGFDGENGWDVKGADYLIEDDNLFEYKSGKWEYVKNYRFVETFTEDELRIRELVSSPSILKFIKHAYGDVNIYMEFYDKNWNGNYPTVIMENVPFGNPSDDSGVLTVNDPKIIDTGIDISSDAMAVLSKDETTLFVIESDGKLKAIDVRNPKSLSLISEISVPKLCEAINISNDGKSLFIKKYNDEAALYAIDISNLHNMRQIGKYTITGDTDSLLGKDFPIIGEKIYLNNGRIVTHKDGGLHGFSRIIVLDNTDPANMKKLASYTLPKYLSHYTVSNDGRYLYGVGYTRLHVFDLSKGGELISTIEKIYTMDHLVLSSDNKTLFIVGNEGKSGGHIIDVSDPENIRTIDTIDTWNESSRVRLSEKNDMMFVTNVNGVQIWDIADINHKQFTDIVEFNHISPSDIVVPSSGDRVYVFGRYGRYFKIINLTHFL